MEPMTIEVFMTETEKDKRMDELSAEVEELGSSCAYIIYYRGVKTKEKGGEVDEVK